jgi:hypothetical protein
MKEVSGNWIDILSRKDGQVALPERAGPPLTIPVPTGCIPAILSVLPPDDAVVAKVRPFASFLSKIRYYPVDEPNDPTNPFDAQSFIQDSVYKQAVAQFKAGALLGGLTQSICMRLVYLDQTDKARFRELLDLTGAKGLKLIDDIDIATVAAKAGEPQNRETFYVVNFKLGESLGNGDRFFRYSDLSLGTRRIIHILLSLVFDDSSVMLIEHPEDGIHMGLLGKFVSLMETNSDPTQIIVSSHSLTFLNKMKPEDIRLVTLNNNESKVRSLTAKEVQSAKKYITEDGTLYEYLETIQQE